MFSLLLKELFFFVVLSQNRELHVWDNGICSRQVIYIIIYGRHVSENVLNISEFTPDIDSVQATQYPRISHITIEPRQTNLCLRAFRHYKF